MDFISNQISNMYYMIASSVPVLASAPDVVEFNKPWRSMNWGQCNKNDLLAKLNTFQPGNPEVNTLKILLHGPIGSGKSSFINSVDSVFKGRNTTRALAQSMDIGDSFSLNRKTYKLKRGTLGNYPFTFTDISGIQEQGGIWIEDINKILHGHIRDDYTFNPVKAISEDDPKYNRQSTLGNKIHCLVTVLPANTVFETQADVFKKMREVRERVRHLVIIMTKVDEACPLVKDDLQKIYTSKKIRQRMEVCSNGLGVPVNCIFPVKNYHEENTTNTTMDILILEALMNILNFANDYVEDQISDQ